MSEKQAHYRAGGDDRRTAEPEKLKRPERLLNLVSFLLKEHEPTPWNQIRDQIYHRSPGSQERAVERQFDRDKLELKKIGIPLKFLGSASAGGGYTIDKADYFLPQLQLSPDEVFFLQVAANLEEQRAGGHLPQSLDSALQKVLFDATDADSEPQPPDHPYLANYTGPEPAAEALALETLTNAVIHRWCVTFRYQALSTGQTEQRIVEPYGLARNQGRWYLVGHCRLRKAIRIFRLDRIQDPPQFTTGTPTEGQFCVPESFCVTDHVGRPLWEIRSSEASFPITVKVLVSADATWLAAQRIEQTGCAVQQQADGACLLTLDNVLDPEPLIRWVLCYEEEAIIVSPPAVRDRLLQVVRSLLARYGDEGDGS